MPPHTHTLPKIFGGERGGLARPGRPAEPRSLRGSGNRDPPGGGGRGAGVPGGPAAPEERGPAAAAGVRRGEARGERHLRRPASSGPR